MMGPTRTSAPDETEALERWNHRHPDSTPHDVYMRQLAARIAWLQRHRHWWIRSIEGRWT